jgi:RNA polymerase sigma-70 factor (ECF subfamily)
VTPVIATTDPKRAAGNRRAEFERTALPHLDSLYRTALWLARNQHDAEELVQETYFRAYRSFVTFGKGTNCRAWLFKILINSNITRARLKNLRSERVRFEDVEPFLLSSPTDKDAPKSERGRGDVAEQLDEEVKWALGELPEAFRIPVVLSSIEGLTYIEISRVIGCPMGTVMSRVYRGRRLLRRRLAAYAQAQGYQQTAAVP